MNKLIGLVILSALLIAGFFLLNTYNIRSVTANVVFGQPGKYYSPSDECYVNIFETKEGKLKYSVHRQAKDGHDTINSAKPFEKNSDWFMCWDIKQNKLAHLLCV